MNDSNYDNFWFPKISRKIASCRKTLNLGILRFSLVCKSLIFKGAKIIGIGHLDFFDSQQ